MDSWANRLMVLLAFGVAALLVGLGLRRRLAFRLSGKSGVFWAALAFFLLAGSCELPHAPLAQSGNGAGIGGQPAPGLVLPPELMAEGRFQKLKAFWTHLDKEGRKAPLADEVPSLQFGGAATPEVRQALHKELADALGCPETALTDIVRKPVMDQGDPENTECKLSPPTRILAYAALARIWALGPDNSMMMHMLPSPDHMYHNKLKARLQQRFELLVYHKSQGKLLPEEFAAALARLEEQTYHLAMFEIVRSGVGPKIGLGVELAPLSDKKSEDTAPANGQPNSEFLPQTQAWVQHAQQWCQAEQKRLESQPSPEQKGALEQVVASCNRMEAAFKELAEARPLVLQMLRALEE